MFIVMTGSPFDGMTAYGPFDDYEAAAGWAEKCGEDWWALLLAEPE